MTEQSGRNININMLKISKEQEAMKQVQGDLERNEYKF